MNPSERRWSEDFRRVSTWDKTKPRFSVKGAIDHLYDGYAGGHEVLDRVVGLCEEADFVKMEHLDRGSPIRNVTSYEYYYVFLDGGLHVKSGNYFGGERGASIEGFLVLRWVLHRLGYTQPRKLKGEEEIPSRNKLENLVAGQPG
jgi:hypothetical protein